eukprot:GHVO01006131.1.p1 GENE.GHVO01006131.1~~GHVO01006131.1.p1  ORF type:complete len:197 (-),score=40.46 GHVO01006131.1:529-1119(-)
MPSMPKQNTSSGFDVVGHVNKRRLLKEYRLLATADFEQFKIRHPDDDLYEAHFAIYNLPSDTPYDGGVYHGKLELPKSYPNHPPKIYMLTPSGRFIVNVPLCFSMSSFHPETWNPLWTMETIVRGFISFMLDEGEPGTYGGIHATRSARRLLAARSREVCGGTKIFRDLFPDLLAPATVEHTDQPDELPTLPDSSE